MSKEFNVGETAWWAFAGSECLKETCPTCFGKRKVVVILGNDESFEVDCDYCGKGYEGPRGYVQENYKWHSEVRQIVINEKQVRETNEGQRIDYWTYDHRCPDQEDLFSTKEEAEARVVELIKEQEIQQTKDIERRKEYKNKSYAWHVGYHQRCAKKAQHDFDYHTSKVIAMEKLSKLHTCAICGGDYDPKFPHTTCYEEK